MSLGFSEHFHRHIESMLRPSLKTDPPHVFRFFKDERPETATSSALAAARRIIDQNRDELAALVIDRFKLFTSNRVRFRALNTSQRNCREWDSL